MTFKFLKIGLVTAIALMAVIGTPAVHAQSVITTLLGDTPGAPSGEPALSVAVNLPSAVASDGHGSWYVALRGAHQVVRIDPSGLLWLVAGTGALGTQGPSGDGGPAVLATLASPLGLAFDSSGNLYISDAGSNRIRLVNTTTGIITTFAGNGNNANSGDGGPAINASLDTPTAIAFDNSGNLLICDTGNSNIRSVTPGGIITKVAGIGAPAFDADNGTVATAAFSAPTGVAVDPLGNIYVSDTGNQRIRMIAPSGVTSVFMGTGLPGSFGDGRQADTAELRNPGNIFFDSAGNFYVADIGNDRVRTVSPTGLVSNFAGSGTAGAGGDGGLAYAANLNLLGIGIDPQNNVAIADGANYRVRLVTASNGFITSIAGDGVITYDPTNLIFSGTTITFSDSTANRIRQFNLSTGAESLTVFAGTGAETFDDADDTALTARLNAPRGLNQDKAGNIYFADSKNQVVREITPEGALVTLAGTGVTPGIDMGDGALAVDAELSGPIDVAYDNTRKSLYILETSGARIRVITADGNINTYAGTGVPGQPSGSGGSATSQPVNNPQGMIIDSSGNLYIADSGNNLIREITTGGNWVTIAGSGNAGFSGDGGPALSASLRNPSGLALDSYGNIFIADTQNNVIREVGADGIISTIAGVAGSTTGGYTGDGAPATSLELSGPTSVAIGPACSVLVADVGNERIRQVFPAVAYSITTNPAGLQVIADGQTVTTPAVLNWLPGTSHTLTGPSTQSPSPGTEYTPTSASQSISVTCGAPRASASVSFAAQYYLTINAGAGGTVSQTSGYEPAGTTVTLTASPNAGYTFSGWQGACSGTGSCQVTMNAPETVSAQFTATGGQTRRIPPKRIQ